MTTNAETEAILSIARSLSGIAQDLAEITIALNRIAFALEPETPGENPSLADNLAAIRSIYSKRE